MGEISHILVLFFLFTEHPFVAAIAEDGITEL